MLVGLFAAGKANTHRFIITHKIVKIILERSQVAFYTLPAKTFNLLQ
jgi:hypothetical protein